ncbi:hypothetical protein LCGC14_1622440, partial [marine sediment metagenome]
KETALREYLLASWEKTARQAARAAGLRAGKKGATAKRVERIVREIMDQWAEDVLPRHLRTVGEIYRLAREAGWKKATKQTTASLSYTTPNFTEQAPVEKQLSLVKAPTFDLVDDQAVAALQRHQVFWLGRHYGSNVSAAIAETAREVIVEAGEHPKASASPRRERMQEELGRVRTPKGWHGSARQYFEGLAANAATTARAHGQLRSFQEYGITRMEVMNPMDARTCEVCSAMDGRVFTVEQGAGIMEAEQAAKTPAQVRAAHPFLRPKNLVGITKPGKRGGRPADNARLARGGFALPGYHFRCRCTVEVTTRAGSWTPI